MAEIDQSERAWGGIGGSGRHAMDLLPDLAEKPEAMRAIVDILQRPEFEAVLEKSPTVAWGGIGGSGKHAFELEPELREGSE